MQLVRIKYNKWLDWCSIRVIDMVVRPTAIAQEIVAEFQKLLDSGLSKLQASRQLGFTQKGLASAAKRYGHKMPLSKRGKRRGDIKKEFLRRLSEFH